MNSKKKKKIMLSVKHKLPNITIGHYSTNSCSCACENVVENKGKLMFDILDCYIKFDNLHIESHLKLGFVGNMSYPIAKGCYKTLINYPLKLGIDVFDSDLTNCSLMLKNNIEEGLRFGVYNFDPENIHSSLMTYKAFICSDLLFSYKNRIGVFEQIYKVLITDCYLVITDILKKDGKNTKALEEDLDIPELLTMDAYKELLFNCNFSIVNVLDYTRDLAKHTKLIDNKILYDSINKLSYKIIICKKN